MVGLIPVLLIFTFSNISTWSMRCFQYASTPYITVCSNSRGNSRLPSIPTITRNWSVMPLLSLKTSIIFMRKLHVNIQMRGPSQTSNLRSLLRSFAICHLDCIHLNTFNPLYSDTRYNEKIRYSDKFISHVPFALEMIVNQKSNKNIVFITSRSILSRYLLDLLKRPFYSLNVLGFNDTSTLVGHFVSSPRERGKEKVVEQMKEMNREERGAGMKVKKQKKQKHSPSILTCYKDRRPFPTVSQYQLDAPVT